MPTKNDPKDFFKSSSSSRVVAGTSLKSVVPNGDLHGSPIIAPINQTLDLIARVPLEIKPILPTPFQQQDLTVQRLPVSPPPGSGQPQVANQGDPIVPLSSPDSDYFYLTGLKEGQPTIVLTSEFIPVYQESSNNSTTFALSSQGRSLQTKEEAKLMTAATAITALSQSLPVLQLVRESKSVLNSFLRSLSPSGESSTNIEKFTKDFYGLEYDILPSSFEHSVAFPNDFFSFLSVHGHSTQKVQKYSESKLWLQTLVEAKRSLLSYSPSVREYSRRTNLSEDNSPVQISKNSADQPRVYLNPYTTDISFVTDVETLKKASDLYPLMETSISDADKKQYSRHSKVENIQQDDFNANYSMGDDQLNCLFSVVNVMKEIRYSLYFSKPQATVDNRNILGYESPDDGRNYKFWDAIFGNIPDRITDKIVPYRASALFETSALCSLSQYYYPDSLVKGTKVLTFESSPPADTVSGFRYFFEKNIEQTIDNGLTTPPTDEYLTLLASYCVNYRNVLGLASSAINDSSFIAESHRNFSAIDEMCAEGTAPGSVYLKLKDLIGKPQFSSQGSVQRFQSILCKLALSGDNRVKTLKTNLFLWFMSQIIEADNRPGSLRTSIDFYESKIVENVYSIFQKYTKERLEEDRNKGAIINVQTYSSSIARGTYAGTVRLMLTGYFFPVIKRLLTAVYKDPSIYKIVAGKKVTAYSGLSVGNFLYSYFDMLLRVVSMQTPETFKCFFEVDIHNNSMNNPFSQPADEGKILGISVTPPTEEQKLEYFNLTYPGTGPIRPYLEKISYVYNKSFEDAGEKIEYVTLLTQFINRIDTQVSNAKRFLKDGRLYGYLQTFESIFVKEVDAVWVKSDSNRVKKTLMKMSLHKNQLKLLNHAHGELRDRILQEETNTNSLKSLDPTLEGLLPKENFTDLLPIDDLGMVSFKLLSSFYKRSEFSPNKGNNKRIISVGIPDGLLEKLQSSQSRKNKVMSNHVRLKVWKLDRLYPDVLFRPIEYVFDMNRFPTRSLRNWELNSRDSQGREITSIPTKYYSSTQNRFYVHKNVNEAEQLSGLVPTDVQEFSDFITDPQARRQFISTVYNNHVKSFLCEEYLKWYTDVSFNETDFYNYNKLNDTDLTTSYQRLIEALRRGSTQFGNLNVAEFIDPLNGDVVSVPIQRPQPATAAIPQTNTQTTVQLSDTTVSYLRSQSYLTSAFRQQKKVLYPKKFDRVFHVLVDPDDFVVESSVLTPRRKEELIKGPFMMTNSGIIVREDTRPGEVSFQEFFVSIEPYEGARG